MRRWALAPGVIFIGALSACQAGDRRARSAEERALYRSDEHIVARPMDDENLERPGASRSILFESFQTRTIEPPPPPAAEPRPRTRGRIDIDLKGAALGDALRFIADSGGFNLVVEGEPVTPITVELHGVDAFDALVVVSESQGLEVFYSRGIVRVGKPQPHVGVE